MSYHSVNEELSDLRAKWNAAERKNRELLEALEEVEFIATVGFTVRICPWCARSKASGHRTDCVRQAAIAKVKP